MKILIGTVEVCGLIHELAKEYRKQGHKVTTIGNPIRNFNYKYDIDKHRLIFTSFHYYFKNYFFAKLACRLFFILGKKIEKIVEKWITDYILSSHDVYINIWAGLLPEDKDIEIFKNKGGKVITLILGSEIRDHNVLAEEFDVSQWTFPENYYDNTFADRLKKLRLHEKISDLICSVPDQAGLALRPYYHLQLPLDLRKFKFSIPGRDIPLVIHAPSDPYIKGTDVIENTLSDLARHGVKFEYKRIRGMNHSELLELLSEADVVVDELVYHGPGFLGLEAMASGCAVATRYIANSPDCFKPPVWNINADNIYHQLYVLLTNRDLRIELATEGGKYIMEHNNITKIAEDLLSKVNEGQTMDGDYIPAFLIHKYKPKNTEQINLLNYYTDYVKDCNWYKKHIISLERDGLKF